MLFALRVREPAIFPMHQPRRMSRTCAGFPLFRYPYTIFYRIDATVGQVEIVRVVHGARVRNLGRLPNDE